MTSRRSSGSMRAESAVEPTRSENITVTWRRSAVSWGFGSVNAGCGDTGAAPASSAIAANILRRCPSDMPIFSRSVSVKWRSTETSMSLSAKLGVLVEAEFSPASRQSAASPARS